jgi:2-polyprenyl-3-methyl-5-hydroxy-6-metoxy-1,4-benzoquinol methylase
MSSPAPERACWCGHPTLSAYSADYHVCRACGTLVSRAPLQAMSLEPANDAAGELYSKDYWTRRQAEHHELPQIEERARLDLPERSTHWLQHLLSWKLPPGRVLEVGCGHGGFVALLGWAGFDAVGTEMSRWVVDFARRTFAVEALAGPIESQPFPPASFDVIVLNDVIEHLADPVGTMRHCARLLRPDGFFVIQTPEYKEHLGYADLVATNDLFLRHMDRNNDEHLFLFSRRSAQRFFEQLGYPVLAFQSPVYPYDMYFTASRTPLPSRDRSAVFASLAKQPHGRLVAALLDKAHESNDRWWAVKRMEAALEHGARSKGQESEEKVEDRG